MLKTLLNISKLNRRLAPRQVSGAQFKSILHKPSSEKQWLTHQQKPHLPKHDAAIDQAKRLVSDESEECYFPSLKSLGISTNQRVHTFNVSCDQVIKYIKLGAVNKYMALQYCHYLCHLCRASNTEEDRNYYSRRINALLSYFIGTKKHLDHLTRIPLLCDIASSSPSSCNEVCKLIIEQKSLAEGISVADLSKILISCYKHQAWGNANDLFKSFVDEEIVNVRLFDPLVLALVDASIIYNGSNLDSVQKNQLKGDILEHLTKLIEGCSRDRVQFITRYPVELADSLVKLKVKVTKNPIIKFSGRCHSCNIGLPLYDSKSTSDLNSLLRNLLYKKAENKVYLHTTPDELSRFERFLTDLKISEKSPIDCVIDGLNIAYKNSTGFYHVKQPVTDEVTRTVRRHRVDSQVQVLINTILRGQISLRYRRILVVGKEHMIHWPGLMNFFDKHNILFYGSPNDSKDDLFMLVAATLHPRTVLVTNDFLRDHVSILPTKEERKMLERWIDTHQAWIASHNLKPIWPTSYQKIASFDKHTNHFHIPVIDYTKLDLIAQHEPPPHLNSKLITWLCCKDEDPTCQTENNSQVQVET